MLKKEDDNNSVCSDCETTKENVATEEKENNDDDKDEDEDDEDKDEEDEENEDKEDEDNDEEDEDDDEDEEDDDEEEDNDEFDATIIQFEMLKNFFIDKEGENISTHLGSISHELRKLNKIAVRLLDKK
jgi:hypothetical protein